MPGTDGIAATRQIRKAEPGPAVIILTTFDEDAYVLEAVRAGACGFLLKDGDIRQPSTRLPRSPDESARSSSKSPVE